MVYHRSGGINKIFLDIGSFTGITTKIILEYNFDIIHCFEPVKQNYKIIEKNLNNEKINLHKFGLLNKTCDKLIYNSGSQGGSVFKEKKQEGINKNKIELCNFIKASDWFKDNICDDDYTVTKINVEGAEINIINDLLDTGEYDKIDHLLFSFDIEKVRGKEYLQEELLNRLKKENKTNYTLTAYIKKIVGCQHKNIINYWLKLIEEKK